MLQQATEVLNMDAVTEFLMAGIIEGSRWSKGLKMAGVIPELEYHEPGKPLKILLTGYNGARNTGADVRVVAMVEQFYHVLGPDNVRVGVMTLDGEHTGIYFEPPTEMIEFSSVFFHDLLKACSAHHMAVLSEGSCFKSKFANALTTFFVGTAGIMHQQGKPVIAYGSECGSMDWLLKEFVKHYCKDAYIISRTVPSMSMTSRLGLEGELGTDTAWTFRPGPVKWATKELRNKGWDGKKPIVGAAVINPFCWPVRPNLYRYFTTTLRGKETEDHYDKWYFFSSGEERKAKLNAYLEAVAKAMDAFVEKHDVFPVIIGMERLDHSANQRLQELMRHDAPIFCSVDYDGYQLTSILWKLSMLMTSRYHARVLSMLAGVPSGALSMDERLENLLRETGHIDDYYLAVDDPDLEDKLPSVMEQLWENRETVQEELLRSIPGYLEKMANMGRTIKSFARERFPGLALPPDPADWLGYLPRLHPKVAKLVEKYG